MKEIYFARQPIYNRNLEIEGYELFYRHAETDTTAQFLDAEIATSQIVLNTVTEVGLERIAGKHKTFINVARDFILDGHLQGFAMPQLVFEIVADIVVDGPLLQVLRELREQGCRFVLDDYYVKRSLPGAAGNNRELLLNLSGFHAERQYDELSPLGMGALTPLPDIGRPAPNGGQRG